MARITGSTEQLLGQVQRIVREHIPGANCSVVDYGKRIGCGELDAHGKLHEVRWMVRDLDDENVRLDAERVAGIIANANRRVQTDC